jgi:hypothetical protein
MKNTKLTQDRAEQIALALLPYDMMQGKFSIEQDTVERMSKHWARLIDIQNPKAIEGFIRLHILPPIVEETMGISMNNPVIIGDYPKIDANAMALSIYIARKCDKGITLSPRDVKTALSNTLQWLRSNWSQSISMTELVEFYLMVLEKVVEKSLATVGFDLVRAD